MDQVIGVLTPSRAAKSIFNSPEGLCELVGVSIVVLVGPLFKQGTLLESVVSIRIINETVKLFHLLDLAAVVLVSVCHITWAVFVAIIYGHSISLSCSLQPLKLGCLAVLLLKHSIGDIVRGNTQPNKNQCEQNNNQCKDEKQTRISFLATNNPQYCPKN